MSLRCMRHPRAAIIPLLGRLSIALCLLAGEGLAQVSPPPAHSTAAPKLDPGAIKGGLYHNQSFAFSCKIPFGWVLRTDDLNAREGEPSPAAQDGKHEAGHVLLAAFSRPPQARAEEVNSSILIAAESASAYPGLKDPVQYLAPFTEVAKAQGFAEVEDPYEFPVGTRTLPRGDFQKDTGSRVMRQSTLVMLVHGYAVSFTFIAGTADELEELISGLSFQPTTATKK